MFTWTQWSADEAFGETKFGGILDLNKFREVTKHSGSFDITNPAALDSIPSVSNIFRRGIGPAEKPITA